MIHDNRFSPTWRDDVFDPQALEIPLLLPEATAPGDGVWVKKYAEHQETIFGTVQRYTPFRELTAVVKKSDMSQFFELRSTNGIVIKANDPGFDVLFPPKAWMTDSGEERCAMFAAARSARGRVLVGGLGLAVYPQLLLHLERPVSSITIVERNPDVIRLVQDAWLGRFDHHGCEIEIVEDSIEAYLEQVEESFDTIYLDTWEDADPRFLAHINHLIQMTLDTCTPNGQIQCWGYAKMIETFVQDVKKLTELSFPWQDHHLDPVLNAYVTWLDSQSDPTPETIENAARECALSVCQSIDTYDRHRCFTGFGRSLVEAHINMSLSLKHEGE